MPNRPISLRPVFHPQIPEDDRRCTRSFLAWANRITELTTSSEPYELQQLLSLRNESLDAVTSALGPLAQPVRFALAVLFDLAVHGWGIMVDEKTMRLHLCRPEGAEVVGRAADRERVRRSLSLARAEQLAEPSVRQFVESMTTRRIGPQGDWVSILSLMRNGHELANSLTALGSEPTETALSTIINPYLQFITDDNRCNWTGYRLADIWRYFRYTWLNPARSVPGRQMMVLVRDAAHEFHPVIGIAALSSSIVQQSTRDEFIGWNRESVLAELRQAPTETLATWLLSSLEDALSSIYLDDLVNDQEKAAPDEEVIARLRQIGVKERERHKQQAANSGIRRQQAGVYWEKIVTTPLYRSKRALALSDLLSVRKAFTDFGLTEPSVEQLRTAMVAGGKKFEKAVARLVRQIKAKHVGIQMMDVSVAGAIPPYNALLGGKLVSLLLLSPEVRQEYSRRYNQSPSIIASGMLGTAVVRPPELVLLCTTGLFGGGSSQYNRLKFPASEAIPGASEILRYERLDKDTLFTTFHISQATLVEMHRYAEQWHDGSNVHNIFGEGVNPKMRRIREGLSRIGFPAEAILQAGSPRSLYVIPLAKNFREVLLGKSHTPAYMLPTSSSDDAPAITRHLIAFWHRRWLAGRVLQTDVLDAVRGHTLTYPIQHGALVGIATNQPEMAPCNEIPEAYERDYGDYL